MAWKNAATHEDRPHSGCGRSVGGEIMPEVTLFSIRRWGGAASGNF
jgi:hypothetical protein